MPIQRYLRHPAIFLIPMLFLGCQAQLGPAATGSPALPVAAAVEKLSPDIEGLYLAWRELDTIHKDFKALEKGLLFAPDDRQLGYAQKAALYIQDALVRTHHNWEQLSVLAYIREDRLEDYLTISARSLTACLDELDYDQRFISIYAAFITNQALVGDLQRARAQIEAIAARLRKLHAKLQPWIHPPRLPSIGSFYFQGEVTAGAAV